MGIKRGRQHAGEIPSAAERLCRVNTRNPIFQRAFTWRDRIGKHGNLLIEVVLDARRPDDCTIKMRRPLHHGLGDNNLLRRLFQLDPRTGTPRPSGVVVQIYLEP